MHKYKHSRNYECSALYCIYTVQYYRVCKVQKLFSPDSCILRWMYRVANKLVFCNLGHSQPEPLMRDFLSRWISYWSPVRSEIPAVSSQHFLYTVACCCRNPQAKRLRVPVPPYLRLLLHSMFRLASALATWFATLLTPHAKNCLPLTSDQSSLSTLHCCCILLNYSSSRFCLVSKILSFALSLSFALLLCVPPQRSGL